VARVMDVTGGRGANGVIVAVGGAPAANPALQLGGINASINLFAGTYPRSPSPWT